MWGRRDGIRGRDPRETLPEATPTMASGLMSTEDETTMPASVGRGQTSSWSPCHQRRVRIEGDVSGRNVVVRCPLCSRLWEVRFAPAQTDHDLFALWVA